MAQVFTHSQLVPSGAGKFQNHQLRNLPYLAMFWNMNAAPDGRTHLTGSATEVSTTAISQGRSQTILSTNEQLYKQS